MLFWDIRELMRVPYCRLPGVISSQHFGIAGVRTALKVYLLITPLPERQLTRQDKTWAVQAGGSLEICLLSASNIWELTRVTVTRNSNVPLCIRITQLLYHPVIESMPAIMVLMQKKTAG
jgi:hypothetical protein